MEMFGGKKQAPGDESIRVDKAALSHLVLYKAGIRQPGEFPQSSSAIKSEILNVFII